MIDLVAAAPTYADDHLDEEIGRQQLVTRAVNLGRLDAERRVRDAGREQRQHDETGHDGRAPYRQPSTSDMRDSDGEPTPPKYSEVV